MLGWFSSLKEKSKEVVQLYKNELSNMVYQLDEDIKTLKTNVGGNNNEQKDIPEQSQELTSLQQDGSQQGSEQKQQNQDIINKKIQDKKNINDLLSLLQEYDSNIINNEDNINFLLEQIDFIENSIDTYFSKDPKQLVMIERDDFTNFHVFEEIPNIQEQIKKLHSTHAIKNLSNDISIQKRILYFLIYQFHEKILYSLDQNNNKNDNDDNNNTNKESEEQNNSNQFIKESDDTNIITQDSIKEKEQENNNKVRKGSDQNHSQEDDNWEIDEKMLII